MQKTLLALIILVSTVQISTGQAVSDIELLVRFDNFGTDYFRSTLDTLLFEVEKNPGSKGYVVIYGTGKDLSTKFALEQRTQNHLSFRNLDKKRKAGFNQISIVRATDKENAQVELWISNSGKDSSINTIKWDYILPQNRKIFSFGAGDITIKDKKAVWLGECSLNCEPTSDFRIFGQHLRVNPTFDGHLTIYNNSKKRADLTSKFLTNILIKEFNISRNRIKSIYGGKIQSRHQFDLQLQLVSKNN